MAQQDKDYVTYGQTEHFEGYHVHKDFDNYTEQQHLKGFQENAYLDRYYDLYLERGTAPALENEIVFRLDNHRNALIGKFGYSPELLDREQTKAMYKDVSEIEKDMDAMDRDNLASRTNTDLKTEIDKTWDREVRKNREWEKGDRDQIEFDFDYDDRG